MSEWKGDRSTATDLIYDMAIQHAFLLKQPFLDCNYTLFLYLKGRCVWMEAADRLPLLYKVRTCKIGSRCYTLTPHTHSYINTRTTNMASSVIQQKEQLDHTWIRMHARLQVSPPVEDLLSWYENTLYRLWLSMDTFNLPAPIGWHDIRRSATYHEAEDSSMYWPQVFIAHQNTRIGSWSRPSTDYCLCLLDPDCSLVRQGQR